MLCDWNALAIESLAKASKWLEQNFISRAKRIADNLLDLLWIDNKLYHHGRNAVNTVKLSPTLVIMHIYPKL